MQRRNFKLRKLHVYVYSILELSDERVTGKYEITLTTTFCCSRIVMFVRDFTNLFKTSKGTVLFVGSLEANSSIVLIVMCVNCSLNPF